MKGTVPDLKEPESSSTSATVGYYGLPLVKAHGWKDYIGVYFFTGGLSGAASVLAAAAELSGKPRLAHQARLAAMAGLLPSPPLLIADLTRPARFLNMLRVCKPTSPMSVGTWLLVGYSGLLGAAHGLSWWDRWPTLRRATNMGAGVTGSFLATYTAVLVSDTATPVWHEARRHLPLVFAAGAAASGGAATTVVSALQGTPSPEAMKLAGGGALAQLAATRWMSRHLGPLDAYQHDPAARRWVRASTWASAAGMTMLATLAVNRRRSAARSRPLAILGGTAIAAGSLCERLAVLRAGTASAKDPSYVLHSPRQHGDHTDQSGVRVQPNAPR